MNEEVEFYKRELELSHGMIEGQMKQIRNLKTAVDLEKKSVNNMIASFYWIVGSMIVVSICIIAHMYFFHKNDPCLFSPSCYIDVER